MLQALSKKTVLISFLILMSMMFVTVMFYVNPLIDGDDGSGVLRLQLSFDKKIGIEIINGWGEAGIEQFKQWIVADYVYAFTYSIFLGSLVSFIALKKRREASLTYKTAVYISFSAGILDWIENTMELLFIKDPSHFSSALFFLHSVFAVVKWLAVTMVVTYIIVLLFKRNEDIEKGR